MMGKVFVPDIIEWCVRAVTCSDTSCGAAAVVMDAIVFQRPRPRATLGSGLSRERCDICLLTY